MNLRDITVNYFSALKRKLSDTNLAYNHIEVTEQHLVTDLIYPYLVRRVQLKQITDKHINYLLDLCNNTNEDLVNVFWVSIVENILANCTKEENYYWLDQLPKDLKAEIIEYNNYWFTTEL